MRRSVGQLVWPKTLLVGKFAFEYSATEYASKMAVLPVRSRT